MSSRAEASVSRLQGKLSIRAAELELEATRGNARVEASDRVCLVGELVELN